MKPTDIAADQNFLQRWETSRGAERSTSQQFFLELCALLRVPPPSPRVGSDYTFEHPVQLTHADGKVTTGFIDVYHRGHFVWEAKQGSEAGDKKVGTARRGTPGWDKAMRAAFVQARRYANELPEGRPPFVLTCDVGFCIEVWSGFSGNYGGYGARERRILLTDLLKPEVQDYLRRILTDPQSLNPTLRAAKITGEVAGRLAVLARTLEGGGHNPESVARFLMRCIFTMFAEDVGLLPDHLFTRTLQESWIPAPWSFSEEVTALWAAMNEGMRFGFKKLLHFNGGLFSGLTVEDTLPLTSDQLHLLLEASRCDWGQVEPAIFGTLVERALSPEERHRLGAHFTPRAYIERVVRPTVIEPLQADWEVVQAEVRQTLEASIERRRQAEVRRLKRELTPEEAALITPTPEAREKAAALISSFHNSLCHVRVLDPACGSGNFLYVTFDLLKELEREVLAELGAARGVEGEQARLEMARVSVSLNQLYGIERNPRAREIADLVLWIGYLQWHRRSRGEVTPPEPVLREHGNITCRDAVLAWDRAVPRLGEDGKPLTVWDMRTYKTDPVTGEQVPDEAARVTLYDYEGARSAEPWPEVDFIVSNPPFVGNKMMRKALGDGYVEALRGAWKSVAQTADLVMYWWERCAELARMGTVRRFGLITTNSLTQVFNRKVLETHLSAAKNPLVLAMAVADHPWVDSGADVRIAMTVGTRAELLKTRPVLGKVVFEGPGDGEPQAVTVDLVWRDVDIIHADLSGGANVAGAVPLQANEGLSFQGMNLVGKGFRLTPEEVVALGYNLSALPPVIRPYKNARDVTQGGPERYVIDLFGLSAEEARDQHPSLYQWLLERVKPERDQNKRASYRERWWVFGEPRSRARPTLKGLTRYILTPETSKHRLFVFSAMELIPDHSLYAITLSDAYDLAVLSSHFHETWSLSSGATMGVGNDPRWRNRKCFDPFPFPDATEAQKGKLRELGEKLDAHRKKVQAAHPKAHLTAQYNALDRLREAEAGGEALTPEERTFNTQAQIGILKSLHDDLDAAVAAAYGWPVDLGEEEILQRLVDLNAERAAEEAAGHVRWLRPEFQAAQETAPAEVEVEAEEEGGEEGMASALAVKKKQAPWPVEVADQLLAVRALAYSQKGTQTAEEVTACFKRAPMEVVEKHLETLGALGVLVSYGKGIERRWGLPMAMA